MPECLCGKQFEKQDKRQRSCSKKCARKNKPKHYKRDSLRRNYGMTLEDWDSMFLQQNGCCKICNAHQSEQKKALHVDHDHKTGRIRGLLCQKCNHALGLMNDDPERLERAIEYLK